MPNVPSTFAAYISVYLTWHALIMKSESTVHKIRPVMESIRENSQRYYSLHREVSVDEAMVGFKGRSSMK